MAPSVLVSDRQADPLDADAVAVLRRLAVHTMVGEGAASLELSLSFVDPDEIADLHVRFMAEPGPTDVLSFPQDGEDGLLGDVVVCPSVAAANNPSDVDGELRLLVVHGILHLLGHDHQEDVDRARMWVLQERYAGMRVP
jgi:probable rRNA maturation factor